VSSIFIINFCSAQTPSTDPHWILNQNLSDEFSYTGSQSSILTQMGNKWHFLAFGNPTVNSVTCSTLVAHGYDCPLANKTLAYIKVDGSDIQVNSGICTLSAQYAPGNYLWPAFNTTWGITPFPVFYNFTRCQLVSNALMNYGYYELKFRLPYYAGHPEKVDGIGANMWFFPESRSYPVPPNPYIEMDVFEQVPFWQYKFGPTMHYGGTDGGIIQNILYPNIGWEAKIAEWDAPFNYYVDFSDNQFHTLGFEWQKEYVAIYLDGQLLRSMNYAQNLMGPMNLFLDLNVNPYFANLNPGVTTNTVFPYNYEIDYLRYYDLNTSNPTNLNVCTAGYANTGSGNNLGYTYRNQITLGGSGCTSAKVQSGSDLVLRAKTSITLDEGFECDENTTMYLQVNDR
ncbi:MAG: glycoside hydrolase family 16 protein, partial [Bacteroidia bacterium]|nr:glycoside hydrolase family 16 protein [Bacteroidia bacterium]